MYVVEREDLSADDVRGVIHDVYLKTGQSVYIIDVSRCDGVCSDYYFDGEEELQFLYNSPRENRKCIFDQAYKCAIGAMLDTRCADMKDIYLDSLVLARAYSSFIGDGGSSECSLGEMPHKYFPWIKEGFDKYTSRVFSRFIGHIGFYQIVSNVEWFKHVIDFGVKVVQLRVKGRSIVEVEEMVECCATLAAKYKVRLIVNDHWRLAVKYGASGVHMGQGDLKTADLDYIFKCGLRLGVSTHCYHELARALYFSPSYIALGPIFPTFSKEMRFKPQGLALLKWWVDRAVCDVVAIGGINLSNVESVIRCGAKGIAVMSAVTESEDPRRVTQEFLNMTSKAFACSP